MIYSYTNYDFLQHFRNLQKLELLTAGWNDRDTYDFQSVLTRTLPYVPGIKSLKVVLRVFFMFRVDLKDLVNLSQLEALTYILVFKYTKESEHGSDKPKFYMNLDTVCPKLRVVKLGEYFFFINVQFSIRFY